MTKLYRDFTTRAQIDAEYDVEQSVPDFMHYARQYTDGSAAARRTLEARLGLRYGPTLDEYLDVFPASRRYAPILVFLHGGYWRILSARNFSFVASGPVAAGVTVAVVNYSLCPAVTLDEIVRQTRSAIVWLWRHAREHNADPENIHVCGHSAGGQLTAMAALTEWKRDYGLPRTVVKSGIPISGLFDLEPLRHSFLQEDLRLDDGLVARNSPQFHVRPVPVRCSSPAGATRARSSSASPRTSSRSGPARGTGEPGSRSPGATTSPRSRGSPTRKARCAARCSG